MLFVLQVEIEILIQDILILPPKIILEKKEMGDMSSHTAVWINKALKIEEGANKKIADILLFEENFILKVFILLAFKKVIAAWLVWLRV